MLGLTTYLQRAQTGVWDVRASFLPAIYIEGITLAGGIATLLPPQPVDADIADRVLDGLDGLVLTGGKDVDPASYGQAPHPNTDEPARDRDAWEFALLDRGALAGDPGARNLPRRPDPQRRARRHACTSTCRSRRPQLASGGQRRFNTSAIQTVPGTRLAALIGESTDAQCYHHQAIAELGQG